MLQRRVRTAQVSRLQKPCLTKQINLIGRQDALATVWEWLARISSSSYRNRSCRRYAGALGILEGADYRCLACGRRAPIIRTLEGSEKEIDVSPPTDVPVD
jgi:hypothetical protein